MSRQGKIQGGGGCSSARTLLLAWAVMLVTFAGGSRLRAQGPAPAGAPPAVAPPTAGPIADPGAGGPFLAPGAGAPGMSVAGNVGMAGVPMSAGVPVLAPEIQVVRFHGPEGVTVEVLGPAPEVVSQG